MKAAPFALHRPTTVEDAVALLAATADEGGLVLAGGQSLAPMMALRVAYPPHLIDINGIEPLSRLSVADRMLRIGATVRHARFHRPLPEAGVLGNLLGRVVRHIAHYPIRQRGTFCGSIAHADPASEWCLVATTLGATMTLRSQTGERTLPVAEFIEGALTTARAAEELVVEVQLPLLTDESRFGFYEFNRRAGDFALGMALVAYDLNDGLMQNVRVGLGGIEARARRITAVESALEGQKPDSVDLAEAAARVLSTELEPMEDAVTSQDYRRNLARVVISRALEASRGHAVTSK